MNPQPPGSADPTARGPAAVPPKPEPAAWSLGAAFLLLGAVALCLAQRIPVTELGHNRDPGPRAVPSLLGILLMLGGACECATWWYRCRNARARDAKSDAASSEPKSRLALPGNLDLYIVAMAVAVYIPAMTWLGFSFATLLFTATLLWRLGASWVTVCCTAVGLVVLVHLLFVQLFRVQLPAGVIGLPF